MKNTAFTFGPISAVVMAVIYVLMCMARNSGNSNLSEILIYIGVVLLFVMLFAGIKYYRDHVTDGFITFGQALKAGILISLVLSLCSAILWIVLYNPLFKEFMAQHAAALLEKLKASGASVEEIATKKEEMLKQARLYKSPLLRAGIIFIQGFPVEAVMTVIASFVLMKKQHGVA